MHTFYFLCILTLQAFAASTNSVTNNLFSVYWNGNTYYFSKNAMAWSEAKHFCSNIWGEGNGDLAVINNAEENKYLYEETKRRNLFNAYIGGSDIEHEGKWIWNDGCLFEYRKNFTNWEENEPNNKEGEHCLQFANNYLKWNDGRCELRYSFVCEKKRSDSICETGARMVCPPILQESNGWRILFKKSFGDLTRSHCSWNIPTPQIGYYTHIEGNFNFNNLDCDKNHLKIYLVKQKELHYNFCSRTNTININAIVILIELISDASISDFTINFNYIKADTVDWSGNTYYFSTKAMDSRAAKNFCYNIWGEGNGHLAVINSAEENKHLYEISRIKGMQNAYIGGSNIVHKEIWLWDDGCPFEYRKNFTNWNWFKPNNQNDERCLQFSTKGAKWNNINCDLLFPFVCEKKRSDSICGEEYNWNGNEYYLPSFNLDKKTWFKAREVCDWYWGHGKGDLAIINDATENEKLHEIAKQNLLNKPFIGGSDIIENGKWIWNDNCPFEYRTNLLESETNNEENGKHCLQFRSSVSTWSSVHCQTNLSFICEKKKSVMSCEGKIRKILLIASASGNLLVIVFIAAGICYICLLKKRNKKQNTVEMERIEPRLEIASHTNMLYSNNEQRQLPTTPPLYTEIVRMNSPTNIGKFENVV